MRDLVGGSFWLAIVVGLSLALSGGVSAQGVPAVPPLFDYCGGELVFVLSEPNDDLGEGRVVEFDLDGDLTFESSVTVDAAGFFTISLDATGLDNPAEILVRTRNADSTEFTDTFPVIANRVSADDPSSAVPANLAVAGAEPGICSCIGCGSGTASASSTMAYANSYTPVAYGVELATGKTRRGIGITGFATRRNGFQFSLHHATLVDYDGPFGQGWSHSFNMMIVQTGALTGKVITCNLRIYDITSTDGETWELPDGFFSTLTLNTSLHRWTLTHFSGVAIQFYQGATGHPGLPVAIREPNGNTTRLGYDFSGNLTTVTTDLEQVQTLAYGSDKRLESFTDHIGRSWAFVHDLDGRLTQVRTPETEFADIEASELVNDSNLEEVLVTASRFTTISYDDENFPNHFTAITDQRGATPMVWQYNANGRVNRITINGNDVRFQYNPSANPVPLEKLESTNRITRVRDRENNVCDYEIHWTQGGPLGEGRFGIRRKICWTETGKGNNPLRAGEPDFWEQRWLHDCNCLAPIKVSQPFRSDDGLTFDANGIPTTYPVESFVYNDRRQVTEYTYAGFGEMIRWRKTYDTFANFSRMLTYTEPRGFDDNPLYDGLSFVHTYEYDGAGNLLVHTSPTVTRGVLAAQAIEESWTYNGFGQVLTHTDPNGNKTVNTYFAGSSVGGDINTKGTFGGYLESVTIGATGSADTAVDLTTTFRVNALGMVTQRTDPKGFVYDTEYNDLQETVLALDALVTLRNGVSVRYETRMIYDGAGNVVLSRRSNINAHGGTLPNEFIDRSTVFDVVNNVLLTRVEVDDDDASDLITEYAYDRNDQLAVVQQPEGNRTFHIYDERRLSFKTFYGVQPGATITESYPTNKRANNLGGASFVGRAETTYDARLNATRVRDGRGNFADSFFDFFNRRVATSDPNGNGGVTEYDDASNVLTTEGGAVSKITGTITLVLERNYLRYDEAGRQYQTVQDIDLASDERADVDPDDGDNSSFLTRFDAGGRVETSIDALGNETDMFYDAANRTMHTIDALANRVEYAYDANSNITLIREIEKAGPGATGSDEEYETTFVFDQLNRRTETHVRGLNGTSIDHVTRFAYDSRGNTVLVEDAEGNFDQTVFDDQDRTVRNSRFDGDPLSGTPNELTRQEYVFDNNSRTSEMRAFADIANNVIQTTRYAYDNLDRVIRVVHPDSDDPIDGSDNGPDTVYDRIEHVYDANSNITQTTEQRGVVFSRNFDPGNRLTREQIALPAGVPGENERRFAYDELNRLMNARNNYARVVYAYDAFSRQTAETQSVALDGSGFVNGWLNPMRVLSDYDKQSNRTGIRVRPVPGDVDLRVVNSVFDALNRLQRVRARYFGGTLHDIATYAYFGSSRIQRKTLGNGAVLTNTFDVKRRVSAMNWRDNLGNLLIGTSYGYDDVDNPLHEVFAHDGDLADNFNYNQRYEVTGVNYRAATATDYRTFVGAYGTSFNYDDNLNRTTADFGNPFGDGGNTSDEYAINAANEYTQIERNLGNTNPAHDAAGNWTTLPVRPASGASAGVNVNATGPYTALNMLFSITAGSNAEQHYRYDALHRRIAVMELDGPADTATTPITGRRFIWDGWSVIEERVFESAATLGNPAERLERIYIEGPQIDEHLLAAIDGDGDGALTTNINQPGEPNTPNTNDYEYYYLHNRLGSVMGLIHAADSRKMLEYYRYSVYGEATVLPIVDESEDGIEDAPLDLSDNFQQMAETREASGDQAYGRVSLFNNQYTFTGRYSDEQTGLLYYRFRQYEPTSGRFAGRDPVSSTPFNLNQAVLNNPAAMTDVMGLQALSTSQSRQASAQSPFAGWTGLLGNLAPGSMHSKKDPSTGYVYGYEHYYYFKGVSGRTVVQRVASISEVWCNNKHTIWVEERYAEWFRIGVTIGGKPYRSNSAFDKHDFHFREVDATRMAGEFQRRCNEPCDVLQVKHYKHFKASYGTVTASHTHAGGADFGYLATWSEQGFQENSWKNEYVACHGGPVQHVHSQAWQPPLPGQAAIGIGDMSGRPEITAWHSYSATWNNVGPGQRWPWAIDVPTVTYSDSGGYR